MTILPKFQKKDLDMTIAVQPKHINPRREKTFRVYTPPVLANRIAEITGTNYKRVLDPCIGMGGMSNPYREAGCYIVGCDIDAHGKDHCDEFHHGEFQKNLNLPDVDLVICNSPWNGMRPMHAPEVFIRHIGNRYGFDIPLVMVVPVHFRLNLNYTHSARYAYMRDNWNISSIMACPRKVFDDHEVYCEVLFMNFTGLKAHYWM